MSFIRKHRRPIVIGIIIFVIITLVVPFTLLDQIYKKNFDIRISSSENLYGKIVKENPGFKREPISFLSNKGQTLKGNLYYYDKENCKALIVMAHGYGRTSDSYTQEAEYFARNNFIVMSYDNTGTGESQGDSIVGVSQSQIDLNYGLKYVENSDELKSYPLLLYGHSWGGFAVTAVNKYEHNVNAIVSMSGLENIKSLVKRRGQASIGDKINLLMPYVQIYEMTKFGVASYNTGSKSLEHTDAKILIIHSTDDVVVHYKDSYNIYKRKFQGNPRFEFLLLSGYGHSVALSLNSSDILGNSRRLDKGNMKIVVDFFDRSLLKL